MLMGFPLHHEDGTIRLHLWECQGNKNKFNDVITELIINGRTVEGLFVRIKVKRTSGATEDDWVINNYAPERKEFRVQKIKGPEGKWQSIRDLEEQNL